MRRLMITGVVLLAACGGTQVPMTTTTVPETTTTVPETTTTTTTTTTTVAPTTTIDRGVQIELEVLRQIFDAERLVELCLMQLKMRNGGLPEEMIVALGVDSFMEGNPDLSPEGQDFVRESLSRCFR